MNREDYVIICGDFGGVWDMYKENNCESRQLDWLNAQPFTTLFVSGNHENFDRLNAYPVEEWNGGKVQRIRPSIIHLMRGQVHIIDGKRIFSFGGASNHDIAGGIYELDDPLLKEEEKILNKIGIPYRINHFSWWKEELPSAEEILIYEQIIRIS